LSAKCIHVMFSSSLKLLRQERGRAGRGRPKVHE
jgi:superfamily II DNA helicase RecQ